MMHAHTHKMSLTQCFSVQCSDSVEPVVPAVPTATVLLPAVTPIPQAPSGGPPAASPKALDELDLLGKTLLHQSLPPGTQHVNW